MKHLNFVIIVLLALIGLWFAWGDGLEQFSAVVLGRPAFVYVPAESGEGLLPVAVRVPWYKQPGEYLVRSLISGRYGRIVGDGAEVKDGQSGKDVVNLFPEGTRLLSLEVAGGVARINLSPEFLSGYPSGSLVERLLIYSLVNTVCELPDVSAVQLLVDGRPVQAVGHLDLEEPLAPEPSLVLE